MPLPSVIEALWDFGTPVRFLVVSKVVVDFEVAEAEKDKASFLGVLIPLPAQDLKIKPEGQRKWQAWELYTDYELSLDDMIQDQAGKKFRVLTKENWGSYFRYQTKENPLT